MRRRLRTVALAAGALALAPLTAARETRPAATPVTPAGWRMTPAGHSITVDEGPGVAGPWGVVVSPAGSHALVTSSGQAANIESAEVFDLASLRRTDIEPCDGSQGESAFYGVAYSLDGRHTYVSGGGQKVAPTTSGPDGSLTAVGDIAAGFFTAGLAYGRTPKGGRLYVATNLGGEPFTTGPYEDPPRPRPTSPRCCASTGTRRSTSPRVRRGPC